MVWHPVYLRYGRNGRKERCEQGSQWRFRERFSGGDNTPGTDPAGDRPQRSRRGEDQRKARTRRPLLHRTEVFYLFDYRSDVETRP
jgi:hypothetical protein